MTHVSVFPRSTLSHGRCRRRESERPGLPRWPLPSLSTQIFYFSTVGWSKPTGGSERRHVRGSVGERCVLVRAGVDAAGGQSLEPQSPGEAKFAPCVRTLPLARPSARRACQARKKMHCIGAQRAADERSTCTVHRAAHCAAAAICVRTLPCELRCHSLITDSHY